MNAHQRAWTTTVLPEPDQFPFWREVVWEAFVPVTLARWDSVESRGAEGFVGGVAASQVGPLGVAAISSEAQTVERTVADVRRGAGDVFFLNMPLRGHSMVAQDGLVAELGPGDFAVVDSARPFSLAFESEFEQLSLILPHELLMPLVPASEAVTGRTVRGDAGLGAAVGGALRPFFDGTQIDGAMARPLAERLAALIALALGSGAAASSSRTALTQTILDEIDRSLGDPGLTPALVAHRVGVSTRYLHQLLSARGPSFGRWLLARRLERCRTDLADAELAHWTIAEIGRRNGFTDPSYLARTFRRAYGISPRDYRRATTRGL